MRKIPVILIEKDEKNIQKILSQLRASSSLNSIKFSNNIFDLEVVLAKKNPTVVFIGPSYSISEMEEMLNLYNNSLGYIKIVLLSNEISAEILRSAIKLNFHDVLEYQFIEKDLKASLDRAAHIFNEFEEPEDKSVHNCKKIMFFSTKGGSGNTFLAINFAIALKAKTKSEVIIYDLNYQFGDVALMLNIYPKNTIYDLISLNKYDSETLDIFLTTHNSGIRILPSPIDPAQGETIKFYASTSVFDELNQIGDYLIIDSPFGFSESVLSFIEQINYIFLVATKDVPSVKNLKICLQLLERLKFPMENTYVILNRADSKVDIETEEIEKTIARRIDIKIPSDRIVPISINKGIPAIIGAPRSLVSKNIYKMLDVLFLKKEKLKV